MVNPVNICSAYVHIVALCLACSLFYCMADSGCCHDDLMMIHRRCHDNYCYHRHLILTYSHCYHYYCCDICHLKSSKNLKLKNKKKWKIISKLFSLKSYILYCNHCGNDLVLTMMMTTMLNYDYWIC